MNYILKGCGEHNLHDDVISMLLMFYPNEKFNIVSDPVQNGITAEVVFDGLCCKAAVYADAQKQSDAVAYADNAEVGELKRALKCALSDAVRKIIPIAMPWGILTGVRPAKLVSMRWDAGLSDDDIVTELKTKYRVSDDKIRLMMQVAREERNIVENGKGTVGMYIGIPFCPTRCLYCSFTSYPLKQYSSRVDSYLDALEKEMSFTSDMLKGCELESIYIGGGTPTSLNEEQLERLMYCINKYFDRSKLKEFTVEAGRPDTITREKLRILKKYNADRISINPQTLNDETLKLIGREHSTDMFVKAFEMAREEGHNRINTDIILGLPGEGKEQVTKTMEGLKKLDPESITVHTLAVKRASRLKETLEQYAMTSTELMESLLKIAADYTADMGMLPYYMYRQKNMVGNFENVGYCKPGCQGIYNVQIMEEKQSVIALGAGGSTKIVNSTTNHIDRIFNVKSVDDYITRIDEMLERKRGCNLCQ
jgi:oxygen-independent coproporphyrinogen-3 oxidase